ncbi:hypothetical protein ACB098_11G166100 [Castanea mollissima]
MVKKKSWFNILKRFFIRDINSKQETNNYQERRRKWIFGGLKIKRLSLLTAPSSLNERSLGEAEEELIKNALTVAHAATAAAEEAITTALVDAEIVYTPQSSHQCESEVEEFSVIRFQGGAPQSNHICQTEIHKFASTRIQSASQGYHSFQTLRGIVKLQAIIRGRAVRRQAITTLKRLQSIIDTNNQRRWDDSVLSKEEADALFTGKKEAINKREQIKNTETDRNKVNGRWRYWLDQWVDTQITKSRELEDLDSVLTSNPRQTDDCGRRQLKLRNVKGQNNFEGLDSPILVPKRSIHHRRQCSLGDHNTLSSSPVPTYMAATESAKAKARSMSSPKTRLGNFDTCSESCSPYKNKLSLISSMTTEVPSGGRIGKTNGYQQRSPNLKGLPGPIKSRQMVKDLSFN